MDDLAFGRISPAIFASDTRSQAQNVLKKIIASRQHVLIADTQEHRS